MKKLLLGACIILCAIFSAKAQLPYTQNFEATMNSTPAGWALGSPAHHPKNPGWQFVNVFPNLGWPSPNPPGYWLGFTPTHTYVAYVNDIDYDHTTPGFSNNTPTDNYDTLYTSSFSCAAAPKVFISLDLNFNNYTGSEVGTIAVSTNGGVTWTTAVNLPSVGGNTNWSNGDVWDISAFAGGQANVMLAFTWNNVGAVSGGHCGWGMAVDNINVYAPPAFDLAVTSTSNTYILTTGNSATFQGTMFNWGSTTITSMNLNYSVDGATAVSDPVASLSFAPVSAYNFSFSAPFTFLTPGNHKVKIWADHLNGANVDQNHANDTIWEYFTVMDTVQPKMVMFEEFMQASCDPCMYASPNLDATLAATTSSCNPIRNHVSWPDLDYMNDETQGLFVQTRVNYYGVNGVPDAKIDGTTDAPPGSVSPSDITNAQSLGSPFSINITSATYDVGTMTYDVKANIQAHVAIPNSTVLRATITVDTITYLFASDNGNADQSLEDPKSSFAPPIGTGSTPDSYYQYVIHFPNVAEEMVPSSSGTTLTPFTSGQTQTVHLTWVKNHAWGLNSSVNTYDSVGFGEHVGNHITLFIQDDQSAPGTTQTVPFASYLTHSQTGAYTSYIYQSASAEFAWPLAVEEIANGVYFEMYPNPTNGNTNLEYKLEQAQNVNVQVYNMLGEKVYSADNGKMSAGQHIITLDGQALQSGVYFVKFTTDNATTTKRLVIQK